MNARDTTRPAPPRPRRYFTWPLIVVGLLASHVVAMVTVVVIATGDKSLAVLPNYYQQAVRWDDTQAELRASERLGWRCAFTPSPEVDPLGRRPVTLALADAAGQPVAGADIQLSYFHHTRPTDLQKATLRTAADGQATLTLPMTKEGFWQVNVTAAKAGDRFVQTTTPFVSTARRGPS
jgi:nitrogen fixation protein FixH